MSVLYKIYNNKQNIFDKLTHVNFPYCQYGFNIAATLPKHVSPYLAVFFTVVCFHGLERGVSGLAGKSGAFVTETSLLVAKGRASLKRLKTSEKEQKT
jgi:hypothetical protein